MIVVVADETELEGAEQIVGTAIRDWASDAGGVAVFRCHVPESRGGSVEVDALVCTPQGATVVEVKGFTARQDGTLATPPNGPWTIDDEPAALYHAARVPNPFVQVRRQVFAAKNLLQQSGIFGWVNAVIALVPQPGSDITIEETRIADGYRAVLVGRDDSSALHDYFNAETGRTVRLSVADVSRVFAGLNLRHLLPPPHALAAQGFPAELDPSTTSSPAEPPAVELTTVAGSAADASDSTEVATSGSARMTTRIAQATTPAFLAAIDRLAHRPHSSSRSGGSSGMPDDREARPPRDESASAAPGGVVERAPSPAEPTTVEQDTDSSTAAPIGAGAEDISPTVATVVDTPARDTLSATAGRDSSANDQVPDTAFIATPDSSSGVPTDNPATVGAHAPDFGAGAALSDDAPGLENSTDAAPFGSAMTSGVIPGDDAENDTSGSEDAVDDPERTAAADTAPAPAEGTAGQAPTEDADTRATSVDGPDSPATTLGDPATVTTSSHGPVASAPDDEKLTGAMPTTSDKSRDTAGSETGSGAAQFSEPGVGGPEDGTASAGVVSLRKNLPDEVSAEASASQGSAATPGDSESAEPGDHGPSGRGVSRDARPPDDPGVVFEAGSGWRSGVASYRTARADDEVAGKQREPESSGSTGVGVAVGGAAVAAAAGAAGAAAASRVVPETSSRSDLESEGRQTVAQEESRKPHVAYGTTQEPHRDPRDPSGTTQDSFRDTGASYGSTQDPYGGPHEPYRNPRDPYTSPQGAYRNPQEPYGNTEHWSDWVERDRRAQRPTLASRVRERLRGGDGPSLLERWRNRPVRDRGERRRRLRIGPGLGLVLFIVLFGAGFFAITAVQASRFEMSDYDRMCGERKPFPNAAAYESGGVRPIYLSGALAEMVIPDSTGAWHPRDTSSVQLIACMTQLDLRDLVQTCQYAPVPGAPVGRTVNLFRASYEIVVYEAHSGREVARADMVGERYSADPSNTNPDRCRAAADAPDYLGRRLGQPSAAQVTGFLAPLVGTDH
ncbi:NERD domain-containing protein [Nocardia mangyaensis]|uniref:NERD domain-containing protein n=1 Tax=Nocardia mangyaensis TaxID=2213200 RepID=UPI002675C30E|nr:NERD domain-containing protein [Nocardia mangyaensis]MDO3646716.1 NERD domain-containing protein [Nocardia mangyaensis]